MTKQLHILLTLLLAMIFTSGGAQTTVSFIAGTDKGSDGGQGAKDVSITKDGITLHSTGSDIAGVYGRTDNYRFYKNSTLEVSSTVGNITKVVFTCTANGTIKYGPGNFTAPSTGTYSYSGKTGTWTGDAASFTLTASGSQVRATKVEVTYTKVEAGKTTTTLTFADGSDKTFKQGQTDGLEFTNAATLSPAVDGATINYSSSDESIAVVDNNGAVLVDASKIGSTTITASYAGNDSYTESSAKYTITITPNTTGDGTEKNPYTVADAIALNAAGTLPSNSVYVKGVISKIDKIDISNGNATYYISDDGTTTNQLEIYRGNNIGNAKFTSEDQLLPEWTVTVKGVLTLYGKTLEMGQGNYITSIVKPSVNVPTITGTTAFLDNTTVTITADEGCFIKYTKDGSDPVSSTTATTSDKNTVTFDLTATTTVKAVTLDANAKMSSAVEQTFTKLDESNAISVADALTTADGTTVLVKGIVTRTDAYNSKYTNLNYYLADAAADNELEVYRGMGLKGADITSADDIARGDEVFVYGTLKTYNSTKELDASSIILKQTKAEEKTSITAAGWATYVTARSVDFSKTSDVKAYTVAYSATDDAITLTPVTAVPGNTAVVLKGNQGDYTFTTTTDAAAVSKNNLKFYTKATEVAKAKTVYILANNNGTVGFCPATVGSTVPAYKGYLSISGGTSAKNFFALDGTATGINSIAADKANGRDVRFNLAGQRVDKNYKGVVIVNGKKQLVK